MPGALSLCRDWKGGRAQISPTHPMPCRRRKPSTAARTQAPLSWAASLLHDVASLLWGKCVQSRPQPL